MWNSRASSLKELIYCTGYATKSYTNDDPNLFLTYLSDKINKFLAVYTRWHSQVYLRVDPCKLNLKFLELTKPLGDMNIINYNYYVDEVLESAPPYVTGKGKKVVNTGFVSDVESVVSVEDAKPLMTLSMLNPDNQIIEPMAFRASCIVESQELGTSWSNPQGFSRYFSSQ